MNDVCCEYKKALRMGMILHNQPPVEPQEGVLRNDSGPPWKFIGPNDSCHIECYVDICVQRALERLGR